MRSVDVIRNPVLPGSHPDPSIVRVGPEYYLATSTFEWYPGVRLHHSRDLIRWRPLGGALGEVHLLNLAGCPDSAGVWAPNLSYADGLFHLVYGNVSTYEGGFTDCPTYVVTGATIGGPWSTPVLLHARGFDASLFHDGERSWLVNLVHDWRPGHGGCAGLEATRFDRATRRLVSDPVPFDLPGAIGWIEGPNLYRRGDWYYLLTADGGTGYEHQVTVSRSHQLTGPYQRHPDGPLITAKHHPELALQKAGHGSLVRTASGRWYLAYLVARPHGVHGPCILGRETALAPVEWSEDGWPRVPGGLPALEIPGPGLRTDPAPASATVDTTGEVSESDGFDQPLLGPQWSTLRRPPSPAWLSLTERPSHLRVHGGRSPQSLICPSLVARRVSAARCTFEATIDYRPQHFQHLAGITAYYNTRNWHFLYLTTDDAGSPMLGLATRDRGVLTLHNLPTVRLAGTPRLCLGVDIDGPDLAFRYHRGTGWQPFGPTLDARIVSDEHAIEVDQNQIRVMGFTGAFVGLWVWDLTGQGHPADFDDAVYRTSVDRRAGAGTDRNACSLP
jgi:xylan 1,4-beta-xylosidase